MLVLIPFNTNEAEVQVVVATHSTNTAFALSLYHTHTLPFAQTPRLFLLALQLIVLDPYQSWHQTKKKIKIKLSTFEKRDVGGIVVEVSKVKVIASNPLWRFKLHFSLFFVPISLQSCEWKIEWKL